MSLGIGMQVSAAILSSLGRTPFWEILCPRNSTRVAPIRVFSGIASSYEVVTERKR